MSNLVVLRTYPDRLHAELARSYLESEGIDAVVSSPSQLPGSYLIAEWGDGLIPHEVKVRDEDLTLAQDALAETEIAAWDDEDLESPAPMRQTEENAATGPCPTCGGDRERPDRIVVLSIRAFLWGTVLYIVVALAFLPFTSALNVWAALSILGFIIPTVLFVVRGFFVRARCGFCGQLRAPRAINA